MDLTEVRNQAASPKGSGEPLHLLNTAIDDFQSILTEAQRDKLGKIGSILDAKTIITFTTQLDRENRDSKGRCVGSRFQHALECIQGFSSVVETFVSSHPEIAALVWGSIKLTLLIAVRFTSYFEVLSKFFLDFSPQCPRFAEYEALFPTSTRLQKALCDFHASLIRCCKHVVVVIQRPWQQHLWRSLSQSFMHEVDPYIKDIRRLSDEVNAEITLAKYQADREDQEIQKRDRDEASKSRRVLKWFVSKAEQDLSAIRSKQEQQSIRKLKQQRRRRLEQLSSHDHEMAFREASNKRQNKTAEWICEDAVFTRWYKGTGHQLLWCSGKIGSGKTVLCSQVIRHIHANLKAGDLMGYFLIDHNDAESLKAETIIRSLLRQALEASATTDAIDSRLEELLKQIFVPLEDWTGLLQYIAEKNNILSIVIDGLDECSNAERRNLLRVLSLLLKAANVKLVLASRESVSTDLTLRFTNFEHISLECEHVTSDIRTYVHAVIEERIATEDLMIGDSSLLQTIQETLTQHANGMFLWVAFLIDDICSASCDADIRKALRSLPKSLEETFCRALRRATTQGYITETVQKAFQWVAIVRRPLLLEELGEALAVRIGQKSTIREQEIQAMHRIATWSANLLQITELEPRQVQFAHSSIRDFITDGTLPAQLARFKVDRVAADHFAGEICLTYLHFSDFVTTMVPRRASLRIHPTLMAATSIASEFPTSKATPFMTNFAFRFNQLRGKTELNESLSKLTEPSSTAVETFKQTHPFLQYAREHWIYHTAGFKETTAKTWSLFIQTVSGACGIAQLPWNNEGASTLAWSHRRRHYALFKYSMTTLKMVELDKLNFPIQLASEGDFEMLDLFLQAAAYSKAAVTLAFCSAAAAGHLHMVERLFSTRKVNVNAVPVTEYGWTALQAACRFGHEEVVDKLIKAGADPNLELPTKDPLSIEESYGLLGYEIAHFNYIEEREKTSPTESPKDYENAMLQLIEVATRKTAQPEPDVQTPLQLACLGGHVGIAQKLIKAKADINATALTNPATNGQRRFAYYMNVPVRTTEPGSYLDEDYDGEVGRTALAIACEASQMEVVRVLLHAGAEIDVALYTTDEISSLMKLAPDSTRWESR